MVKLRPRGGRAPQRPPPGSAPDRGATFNESAARENAIISSAQSENALEYWRQPGQPTLSSEDR